MRIQFGLPKERFTAVENRVVRITLRNEGPAPVEFPDPFRNADQSLAYTLTGPEYPEGHSVTWRSFLERNPANVILPDAAPRVRLGAGQAIESTVHLDEWFPLTRPGRYRLTARLTTESFTSASPAAEFDIVPSSAGSASLGLEVPGRWGGGINAAWLQDVEGQPLLMAGGYADNADECMGGIVPGSATVLGPVEPGSTDALAPWTNDPNGRSSIAWTVWRKGASLMAIGAPPATTLKPFRFDLGAPPERIIRPPVETSAGELFIPVVAAGGKELRLIRFQSACDATEITPGREVGRVRIPASLVAARATIQHASVGNGLSILLVEETANGLDLHHVRSSSTGRLTRVASTLVRGLRALPQSEPSLWFDAAGRLHAALVAASTQAPLQAMLLLARYRADGRLEAPPQLKPLGTLPAAPRAAIARHDPQLPRNGELYWAILLQDGTLLHRGNPQGPPMKPRHPAAVPMELFPGEYTYVVTVDPALGPSFEPLR